MDREAIQQWLRVLDSLSYYQLFRVGDDATPDALRDAFHAFAESFHPDVHHGRHPAEQAALATIFKRGAEAYRVLSDPQLRLRYDEALASGAGLEVLAGELDGPRSPSLAPLGASGRLIDTVRAPSARPFVLRAEELARKGDPQQAKLQLVMAMHLDADNPALQAYATELDDAIKVKKGK